MIRTIVTLAFLGVCSLKAQLPYSWSFSAKKVGDKMYEIHCLVDVDPPWHTYSQHTPDGGPRPTKFNFSKNPLCELEGEIKENGMMVVKREPVFGVDVKYFRGGVDFVQKVKLRSSAKTNFSGSVEFMVCNDEQCLPPATQKFTVTLN